MTIHLPAETALALAVAMTDPRYDLVLRRHAAEAAIEDLINFLDETDGDPDIEPSLGWNGYVAFDGAIAIDLESDGLENGELVNEDGGDVQDEPHDELDEGNEAGSNYGWPEYMDQRASAAQCPLYGDEAAWEAV